MDKQEFLERLAAGKMTRRQFNRTLAAAGLATAILPVAARAAAQAVYFTWTGYDDPGFFPNYVAKNGASPETPIFADAEEALTKLRAGFAVDVAHPCNSELVRWRAAGVIQPIDVARLSNWPDVFDSLKNFEGQRDGDKNYFVPVDWGNTSIIYRPDLVDIAEESWSLMWDERYAGKLSMMADASETAIIAGIVAGAANPFKMSAEEIDRVRELLRKQKPLVRFYWNDNTTVEQALASGELVASTGWNSSAVTLKGQGVPVKFMTPKEGILTYCCGLVLSKDAPNPDRAYELMDAMIDPSAGKWLIEAQGYGHSNRKSFDLVGPEMLAERGLPSSRDISPNMLPGPSVSRTTFWPSIIFVTWTLPLRII